MTYYPRAPHWDTYHEPWWRAHIANSDLGPARAKAGGFEWADNDFHLSAPSAPGKTDNTWINAHGAPELFWLPLNDKFENHTAADLLKRQRVEKGHVFKLRTLDQTFKDNAAHGINTEVEVKDVHPYGIRVLNSAFARAAVHAQAAYGDGWREHVVVKVLTDLRGGEAYALLVLSAAHAHGFQTMLLARKTCRLKKYAGHTEITWIRGSAVIR